MELEARVTGRAAAIISRVILLIDNYDSFARNLARYVERLGHEVLVVRNDAITVEQVEQLKPQAILLSPGPCTPHEAGVSLQLVRTFGETTPIFGVCLGHQTIVVALDGELRRSEPVHGRASLIHHSADGIFAGLPQPFSVGRYHSLVADPERLPSSLEVTARTSCGLIMAVRHRQLPIVGVQFHPESVLTEYGYEMIRGFLRSIGATCNGQPSRSDEVIEPKSVDLPETPQIPITF